ncbi:MAG: DUF4870 domain-containing protein, partial [Moorea sp. SIO3C2]|nr:DUF4870 domain-containing protein [Moorena sp. SIO3C2]
MSQDKSSQSWALFLHLSLLLSWVLPLPFVDILAPVIIWRVGRGQVPDLVTHARHALNWMISSTIYSLIAMVTVVGLIFLPILWGLRLAFPIVAAIKAGKGQSWNYPLSMDILGPRPERQLKRAALGFLSLVVLPLVAVLGSLRWRHQHLRWLNSLTPTTGTVTQILEQNDPESGTLYKPVVTFQGPQGDAYEVSPLSWSGSPTYRKDDAVDILYAPTEPQRALINNWTEKWLWVTIVL